MKDYDTIFLDRDGTINPDPGYISKLDDFQFFDFTISSLKKLADGGNRFCIVTNQSGVDRGLIEQINLDEIHTYSTIYAVKNCSKCIRMHIFMFLHQLFRIIKH